MNRAVELLRSLRQRGLGFLVYFLFGYLWPRLFWRWLSGWGPRRWVLSMTLVSGAFAAGGFLLGGAIGALGSFSAIVLLWTSTVLWYFGFFQPAIEGDEAPAGVEGAGPSDDESWRELSNGLGPSKQREGGERLLGRVDLDGLLATDLALVPGFDTVPSAAYRPRHRFDLDLVLLEGQPVLRKDFRADTRVFERELAALRRLEGLARVPRIVRVDAGRTRLYRSLVPGRPLNDLLVAAGATIREADLVEDAELLDLNQAQRLQKVLARGRTLLDQVVGDDFFSELEHQVDAVHRRGVTGLSLTFGNVAVGPGGRPSLFDFDGARVHRTTRSTSFALARDRDRRRLSSVYGRDVLTEDSARALLRALDGGYSPIDLGDGLATRGFWTTGSGSGRWSFLNRRVLEPLVIGRSVLDLGCFNAVMPLLMLRAGALRVVAIEREPEMVAQAHQLRAVAEWRDLQHYDLEVRQGDMLQILDSSWDPPAGARSSFGVVTALCSLYYLEEQEIASIVRRVSQLSPIFVVQVKTDTRAGAADDKARKSSLEFLEAALKQGGFPEVEVIAPAGFSRPLLIGRRADRE